MMKYMVSLMCEYFCAFDKIRKQIFAMEDNIMKKMSPELLADIVKSRRAQKGNMTQEMLSEKTNINRVMIGKIENKLYVPSISQLEKLCEVLDFDIADVFVERKPMYYSAFRGANKSEKDQNGIDYILKMMMISKQQILLRKMINKDE